MMSIEEVGATVDDIFGGQAADLGVAISAAQTRAEVMSAQFAEATDGSRHELVTQLNEQLAAVQLHLGAAATGLAEAAETAPRLLEAWGVDYTPNSPPAASGSAGTAPAEATPDKLAAPLNENLLNAASIVASSPEAPISRTTIAKTLAVSTNTSGRAVQALLDMGLLQEGENIGTEGRPQISLRPTPALLELIRQDPDLKSRTEFYWIGRRLGLTTERQILAHLIDLGSAALRRHQAQPPQT